MAQSIAAKHRVNFYEFKLAMEAIGRFLFVESFLTLAYKIQKLQLKGQNERVEKFITINSKIQHRVFPFKFSLKDPI